MKRKARKMQYPTMDLTDIENMFPRDKDIIFVGNKENFEQALQHGIYGEYFTDRCYGEYGHQFGHGSAKGNRLIAENVANAILNLRASMGDGSRTSIPSSPLEGS